MLTCTLAKVLGGFTCSRLLSQLSGKIDARQYVHKGHSTTDALLYMLQAIYEVVEADNAGARIFFTDFSKGFEVIDHNILMDKLKQLEVCSALLGWIAGFLCERQQAVRIGGTLLNWHQLKGRIPQRTKQGVILFIVMTNRLLSNWHLRIKFVDDLSALEIIPRNSLSHLNTTVNDVHNFSFTHNMKTKTKTCQC